MWYLEREMLFLKGYRDVAASHSGRSPVVSGLPAFTINVRTVDSLTLLNSTVPLAATPIPTAPCSTRSAPPPSL